MSDINDYKKKMLTALEKSMGVVSDASKLCRVSRNSHYRWLKEDPDYKAEVDSLKDVALDFAESSLFSLIREKNPTAVIFYLKTQGKGRGYVERSESVLSGEVKTTGTIVWGGKEIAI